MYSRDVRRGERVSVPENYSGAAFRGGLVEGLSVLAADEPEVTEGCPSECACASCSIPPSLHRERVPDGAVELPRPQREEESRGLFGKEELLILGVALLMGRTGFDTDTLMLMLLLLI